MNGCKKIKTWKGVHQQYPSPFVEFFIQNVPNFSGNFLDIIEYPSRTQCSLNKAMKSMVRDAFHQLNVPYKYIRLI